MCNLLFWTTSIFFLALQKHFMPTYRIVMNNSLSYLCLEPAGKFFLNQALQLLLSSSFHLEQTQLTVFLSLPKPMAWLPQSSNMSR